MTEWLLLFGAVLLTAGTAVFVAAEFSLVALDRPTVQRAIEEGDPRARVVLQSLKQLGRDPTAIDFVLLSHLHGDHFGGVPFLLMEYRFESPRRARSSRTACGSTPR